MTANPLSATEPPLIGVALVGAGWHPASWRAEGSRATELFTARYWVDLVTTAVNIPISPTPSSFTQAMVETLRRR